ncbi:butyrophilin-like protein 1 isoform X4 [Canis lupus familiaris]|nr:butyrophilin-like protein 1 isoform X4 [Canis lupus familiaris]XP_038409610.1 butyrophilin-like protein 1 isoform X4 [Canis lupus familiaris]XP_038539077.1 butyrophilin-like protein 1 isoform X4 [Canis lupus familiaris]XP_038539078.1 butyrophilin-like protein 1 isoform X4 [Canis lupus familiaris]
MVGSPGYSPAGFLLPLLLLEVSTWYSAVSGFSVKGPVEPIMVLLGANATLPCQLSPEQSAADMHIRWYRTQFSPAVFVYQNGQEQGGEQMLEYHGRTELVRDSINRGGVALLIQHVRASDHGQYQCHFKDGQSSQEAIVELHVIGLGSVPHVHMMGPEDGGIRVLCSSDGWFPKPKVQWNDMLGVNLQSLSESQTQDEDGLFHVEASLVVMDSSLGNVTCSIQNPLSGQEKVSCIFLPEPFFPKMDPWKAALAGTVPVLMLLLIGISYTGWREHQAKEKEVKKKKRELNERDQMKNEKEMAQKATEKLKAELEQRKALYLEDWKKALLYPVSGHCRVQRAQRRRKRELRRDRKGSVSLLFILWACFHHRFNLNCSFSDWRKKHFQCANVTVNMEIFHQNNSDSERNENFRVETQDLSLSDKQGDCNLITLNQEDFTSGKHYWEVNIKDIDEWTLGVYEKLTDKSELSTDLQNKKFRVLEKKGSEYRTLTCCPPNISQDDCLQIGKCPQKIVIFLDYEDNDISFYDMTEGTHIFSFTQTNFSGSVYPYFNLKCMEHSHLCNIK